MYSKLKKITSNPLLVFSFKAFFLYALWYGLYDLWIQPIGDLDLWIIDVIIKQGTFFLEKTNFLSIPDTVYDTSYRTMGVDGTHGIWIGDSCNGLTIFALFTGFIVAFPGSIKNKLWFIPFGILTIHILNVLRVVALSIILLTNPESLDFNHTYTFTTIIYGYIFVLWYWWANRLSGLNFSSVEND